jgi:crotonobetaine/carnitine-CoA ligase
MSEAGQPSAGLAPEMLAPHAIARWAKSHPERIAVQRIEGPSFTYAALDRDLKRWAAAFRRAGIAPGDHVATLLPNDYDAIRAWLGLAWLGAIEVPLNSALVGQMLHYCLAHSDAKAIVIAERFAERLDSIGALPKLAHVIVIDAEATPGDPRRVSRSAFLDGVEPARDLKGPIYRDVAALLFTSGTTGASKAVRVPWTVLHHFWSWAPADAVAPGEGVFSALPFFHNSGKTGFNGAMVRGARFVFRERFSGTTFWDDVKQTDCRVACIVGPMTAYLFAQPERADDADNPLRGILCGPFVPEMEQFKKRFGVKMATCYGMTETGAILATGWEHGPWQSCGRARSDYPWPELRVVNEFDEPLGPGEVGELVVRTREPWALNAGYYNNPEKTAEAWRNGWFHTGDAFRYDEDGWYYLVDRMKDAIRRRGENISSFEVENIVKDYPGVVECAAIAVPAELGGDEVMVVIETADPQAFSAHELIRWLEPRMPRFMLPRYVEAVKALPRNESTLRVKKFELRARGVTAQTWDRVSVTS